MVKWRLGIDPLLLQRLDGRLAFRFRGLRRGASGLGGLQGLFQGVIQELLKGLLHGLRGLQGASKAFGLGASRLGAR